MISSRQNQRLKDIRRLRRCKDGSRALLEGPHLLREALALGIAPEFTLATPEYLGQPAARELLGELPTPPQVVLAPLLAEVADSDSPRGLVAAIPLPRGGAGSLPVVDPGVYIYVDGLQDPGNLGALVRTAEAAGASGVALAPGTVSPNHPRALRASAGSLLRLPTAVGVSIDDLDRRLALASPTWVALTVSGDTDLYRGKLPSSAVLALGAEGPGLSPPLLARVETRVSIPMQANVESLNATVAAALVLYELRRRRSTAFDSVS